MKKKTIPILTLCLLLLAAFSFSGLAQKSPKDKFDFPKLNPLKTPAVKKVTLNNGIKLFLIEDHRFPTIDMRGMFYAGSVFDPKGKAGLATLAATVLRTGGTKKMNGDQIDRELETMAASIETAADRESGSVSVSMLKENADRVLAILAEILKNPVFSQDKIDLAKIEARTGISRRNDDVGQIAAREFDKLIYGAASPYSMQPEYTSIDAISREDLVAFYKTYCHPNNFWLAVCGDFDAGLMVKKIEKYLGDWPAARLALPPLPAVDYEFRKTVNYIEKTDVNQSNIAIGHIGGLLNNPDYPALAVMNRILSFDRMFKTIRTNEGLAYSVWGYYGTGFKVPGTFSAGAQTKSGSTVKAVQLMLNEMKRISEQEVSDEELQRAKDQFLNSYVFQFDSRAKIINRMLTLAYWGYPLDFNEQLFKKIEKVTRADVLRVARQYLKPDQVQILVVGKKEDFDKPLSDLGQVNVIDIAIPVPREKTAQATPESLARGQEAFAKAIAAMGNPQKVREIQNTYSKIDMVQATPMGEMKIEAEITIVYPDKFLFLANTPQGKITMILNGQKGIVKVGAQSMPLPEAQRKPMLENFKRDPVYVWKNLPLYQIQFMGQKKWREREVVDLLLSGPVDPFHLYLDPQSFLPAGGSYPTVTEQGPTAAEEIISDYRLVDGIKMPFKSESFANQKRSGESVFKEIKFNIAAGEELFKID